MAEGSAAATPKISWTILIPPPVLAALLSLLFWGVFASLGMTPIGWLMALWPLGLLLVLAGLALAIWGVSTFRRAGTQLMPHAETHRSFVVSGPFCFTRNPMYLGLLTIILGIPLTSGNPLQFLAPIIFFAWISARYIPFEEATLTRQFGDTYLAYKARVRRWI
jgi:protein-S-isoprenylcysteine O-methyltransferase Ste14